MEQIEIILTNCIKDIRSGKSTLNECLNRYTSVRKDLEPLLKVALSIQEPHILGLGAHDKQTTRVRLLQQIKTERQKRSISFTDILSFGLPPRYVWARAVVSVVVVVIVISMAAGGTAYASQSSVPGDLLYPVKIETEDIRLVFAGDSISKAELNTQFASERLAELSKVVNRNEDNATTAVAGYSNNLGNVIQQLQMVSITPAISGRFEGIINEMQDQVLTCDNLVDAAPLFEESIMEAYTLIMNGQVESLEIFAQHNALRATEIDIIFMQNRLKRALITADAGNYRIMEQALLQYQQLNQICQRILQSAQTTGKYNTQIESLILQTQMVNLQTLQNLSQQTPGEYHDTIETCTQITNQLQERARFGYQSHSNSGSGGGGMPSESEGNSSTTHEGQTNTPPQDGTPNKGSETTGPTSDPTSPGDGGGSGGGSGPSNDGMGTAGEGQGGPTPTPGNP